MLTFGQTSCCELNKITNLGNFQVFGLVRVVEVVGGVVLYSACSYKKKKNIY